MRPLNAIEAIQPAWTHTRKLMLSPRRFGLFFKIAAVAFFAQVGGGNGNFRSPGSHGHVPLSPALHAALLASGILIAAIVVIVGLCFFYLGSRLQFVLLEVVLRRDTHIGPIWSRYASATWRWIGLKLLFFVCAVLAFSPLIVPIVIHFLRATQQQAQHGQHINPLHFLGQMLGIFAAIFFVAIFIGLFYVALRDFGLPSMALEGTPLRVTVGRVWSLVRMEPLAVLGYVLMYLLLSFAGSLCGYMLIFLVMLFALIPFGIVGGLLWVALHHAATAGHVVMWTGLVLLAVAYVAGFLLAILLVMGYLLVFMQAYALYFLGGRYPMVGQYLEPLLPVAPAYPYSYAPPPAYPPAPIYPPPPPTPEPEPPLTNPPNAIDTSE